MKFLMAVMVVVLVTMVMKVLMEVMVVVMKNVNWALERVSGSLHFPGEPPALCQPVAQILNQIDLQILANLW